MKQGEAVYQAVTKVCQPTESGAYEPSKEQRESIRLIVFEGFKAGVIDLDKAWSHDEIWKYIPGLISNWLRKDKRLNGGIKYQAKNPGSRSGSSDPQLKALRQLLSTKSDPDQRAEIQSYIDKRQAEIKPTVTLNLADLPEALRAKYSK